MLANWMFFWNLPDWVPQPPPPIIEPPPPETWGTKFKGHFKPPVDPWLENDRASPDYWDVRERYIRRYMTPAIEKERVAETKIRQSSPITDNQVSQAIGQAYTHLHLLQQARDAVANTAREAADAETLRKAVARVIKLTLDISALRVQYYERAVVILLLDLF